MSPLHNPTTTKILSPAPAAAFGHTPADNADIAKPDDGVDHDGELFARAIEQGFGPPELGDYVVELIANRGIELTTSSSSGARFLWFTVRFLEGPRRGRELRLSIVVDGPPSMALLVRRGLQVLQDWRRGTRTPAAANYVSLLRDIARNARRLKVVATFGRARAADGTVIPTLLKVRIEGALR